MVQRAEITTNMQEDIKMVHLVYCDNTGKKGEKVLDKILAGTKTMVVRGSVNGIAKIVERDFS